VCMRQQQSSGPSSSAKSSVLARGLSEENQRKAEKRASTRRKAPEPLLYRVLLEIGSKEKSIKPDRLRKYRALLESPEVRRRAGMTTDPAELAKHASEALSDLVNAIAEPVPRLVAQAALCTETQYEGFRVVRREEMLDKQGIDHDKFIYHRISALTSIAVILESAPVAHPTVRLPDESTVAELAQIEELYRTPMRTACTAADLHYSMLTAMFIAEFHRKFNLDAYQPNRRRKASDASVTWAHKSFDSFMFRFTELFTWEHLSCDFTPEILNTLNLLLGAVQDLGPIFPKWEGSFFLQEGMYSKHQDEIQRTWRAWFYDNWESLAPLPATSRLEPIAAKAGAAALIISGQLTLPVFEEARTSAHEVLTHYDENDEFAPLFAGQSLRHHADLYFDDVGLRLANSILV
jgi:hypothetical protein